MHWVVGGGVNLWVVVVGLVLVVAVGRGHSWRVKGSLGWVGWDKAGLVGQHEINGDFVFLADDVACAVVKDEVGILVVVGGNLGNAVFKGGSDGIFRELVAFDDSADFVVEKCLVATGVASGAEVDAGVLQGTLVALRGSGSPWTWA